MDETISRQLALKEIANRIFFRLYQCDNMLHKSATKALEEFGITSQQWAVLGALSRPQVKDGMAVGELAQFLKVSRQNLSGVITRLEQRDFIEKVTDSGDARARRVKLTQTGTRTWKDMQPQINAYYEKALHGFSFDDHVELLHYLSRLLDSMCRL